MKLFLIICAIIMIGVIIYFEHNVNKIEEKLERIKENGRSNNK